jgi:hypothetical protein
MLTKAIALECSNTARQEPPGRKIAFVIIGGVQRHHSFRHLLLT